MKQKWSHTLGFWTTRPFNCGCIGNGAVQRSISILAATSSGTRGTGRNTMEGDIADCGRKSEKTRCRRKLSAQG
jgi:hypothetical protein